MGMVKNQAALKGGFGGDSFADDDPLAELARIVGFEPVAQPQAPQRIEPAFNLEDELLREFETYRGPTSPIPQAVPDEPLAYAVPVAAEPEEMEPEFEPQADAAWEAEIAEQPANAEVSELPAGETDLVSELEWAIAEHEPVLSRSAAVEPQAPLAPVPVSRFSLPLANFSAKLQPQEPEFTKPAPAEPAVEEAASQSLEDVFSAAFDWKPSELVDEPPVEAAIVEEPVAEAIEDEPAVVSELDPLADLDASDMGFSDHRAAAPVEQEVVRREPDFGLSFADAFAAQEEPVARSTPPVEPIAPHEAIDGPRGRAQSDEDAFDPFADSDFELSLDDLELDLSDFSIDEPASVAPAIAQSVPRQPEAPSVSASFAPVAVAAVSAVAPAVARVAPQAVELPRAAPVPFSSTTAPVSPIPAYTPEPLPFDASEISEQEEPPVALPMLEVPEVPVAEPEQVSTYRPDYDIDLDSELATLFADTAVSEAAPHSAATAAVVAPTAAETAAPAKPAPDEFDAFERALEEDFRETLGHSQARPAAQPTRLQLQEDLEPKVRSGGGRRLLVASVAVIAVLAAGGGYYWLGSGSDVMFSGEPPVILADKDPIKVVPENPGGASVPNQDKAVYDRVEGAAKDPQQKSLISGSEEPVDVVQKTLMPETLPLEGENDTLSATPVGETEDPRLLPGSEPEKPAATGEADAVPITPRKVRTMIVRADGTLVAQETEVPAEVTPAKPAPAEPILAAPSTADALSEPVATPPAAQAPVETAAPATAPVTPAAPETPAAAESTNDVAVAAPVPATRPVRQPADATSAATDQASARPAEPAAAQPAPAQTAAAAPAAAAPEPAPAAAPAPAGGYYVQIASLPSEAEAQKSYQSLSSRFSSVIGGKGVDIKRADIEGKGTYYRVRIPAGSKAEAVSLCESYKAAGGSCLVAR